MKPTNICIVGNFISSYGHTPQMCEFLADEFSNSGHNIIRAGKYYNKTFRLFHMMYTVIKHRNKYDFAIIETFSGKAFCWAFINSLLLKLINKPYIVDLRGGNLPKFSGKYLYFVNKYLKNSRLAVAPSSFLESWSNNFHIPCNVIPNPIKISQYYYKERKYIGNNILWVRRFHNIYNPTMAIKVLSILVSKNSNYNLTMVGPDSGELESCKQLAKSFNLLNHITFLGLISKKEISNMAKNFDIFLNTSSIDNTPFTLIEAAAMGLPIVSTNAGGIPDLFSDNKHCNLVDCDNHKLMAQKIIKINENPKFALEKAKNAYDLVGTFIWERAQLKWEKIFRKINE